MESPAPVTSVTVTGQRRELDHLVGRAEKRARSPSRIQTISMPLACSARTADRDLAVGARRQVGEGRELVAVRRDGVHRGGSRTSSSAAALGTLTGSNTVSAPPAAGPGRMLEGVTLKVAVETTSDRGGRDQVAGAVELLGPSSAVASMSAIATRSSPSASSTAV